jgi:hypothetical protein
MQTLNLPLDQGFSSYIEVFKSKDLMKYIVFRLYGLVVRVLGYIYGGLGSIPCTTRKKK